MEESREHSLEETHHIWLYTSSACGQLQVKNQDTTTSSKLGGALNNYRIGLGVIIPRALFTVQFNWNDQYVRSNSNEFGRI